MPGTSGLLVLGGLVALVLGGEVLVRGAAGLARSMGMSSLLVGLTVVAFATSAPELAVSLDATIGGNPGLAVGNVVGSNIANVLLVLGLSAVILPIAVSSQVLRRDVPVVAVVSFLVLLLSLDLQLGRVDGVLLMACLVAYLLLTVLGARRQRSSTEADAPPRSPRAPRRLAADSGLVAIGVAMLVLGAGWLVDGATQAARSLGVSDLVIGLTVVAVGTSLPELATSVVAAVRGQREMAVGNIVGSCLFNLGAVLAIPAVVAAAGVPLDPGAVRFDLPFMVATAVALLPVAFTGMLIARWEGALFVAYYAAYLVYLGLTATEHDALPTYTAAMSSFVIPLTVLTLVLLAAHQVRQGRRPRGAVSS